MTNLNGSKGARKIWDERIRSTYWQLEQYLERATPAHDVVEALLKNAKESLRFEHFFGVEIYVKEALSFMRENSIISSYGVTFETESRLNNFRCYLDARTKKNAEQLFNKMGTECKVMEVNHA